MNLVKKNQNVHVNCYNHLYHNTPSFKYQVLTVSPCTLNSQLLTLNTIPSPNTIPIMIQPIMDVIDLSQDRIHGVYSMSYVCDHLLNSKQIENNILYQRWNHKERT